MSVPREFNTSDTGYRARAGLAAGPIIQAVGKKPPFGPSRPAIAPATRPGAPTLQVRSGIRSLTESEAHELRLLEAGLQPAHGACPNRAAARRSIELLAAGICLSQGVPFSRVVNFYGTEIAAAAEPEMSLHRLVYLINEANGIRATNAWGLDIEDYKTAIHAESAYSSLSLPGIMANVSGKIALDSYLNVETAVPQFCAEIEVPNFTQHYVYSLTADAAFEPISPAGELKSGYLSENEPRNKPLKTYGRYYKLSRYDWLGNNLAAFFAAPRLLGRQAALSRDKVVLEYLASNPSNFFSMAKGNILTGGASVLSIDAINAADLAMRNQADVNGAPLYLRPAILLVPNALAAEANQICASLSNTPAQEARSIRPVVGGFLADPNAFYLLADPRDVPAVAVASLAGGGKAPTIETRGVDGLDVWFRGYQDIGVSLIEPKAIVKSTGQAA